MQIKQILKSIKNTSNKNKIVTGQEIETNDYLDNKKIYRKRMYCGAIPNNSIKRVPHELNNITFINFSAIGRNQNGSVFAFPFVDLVSSHFTICQVSPTEIVLQANYDISNYDIYVDLYYTKN